MAEKKEPEPFALDVLALVLTLVGLLLINNLAVSFGLAFALSYSLNRVFFTSLMRYSRWAVLGGVAIMIGGLWWQGQGARDYNLELKRIDYQIADLSAWDVCRSNSHTYACEIARLQEEKLALALCQLSNGRECP
jgi:hypothetical protein